MEATVKAVEIEFTENEINALRNGFGKEESSLGDVTDISSPGEIQQLLAEVNKALQKELNHKVRVRLLRIRKELKRVIEGIHKVEY